jgi:hypothetical protein
VSVWALVGGVAGLNAVFVAVGYCVLSPTLRGASARAVASYGAVALLVGAGLIGAVLCVVVVAGATIGPVALAVVAAGIATAGLAARRLVRLPGAEPAPEQQDLWLDAIATVACAVLVAICGFALVGGFRSSPWLDDTWTFWLPKGIALGQHGLDLRLWAGRGGHVPFVSPDYPLWWPSITGLDVRFVGSIDLRAVNGQLGILAIAFLGTLARLLWGLVRPWLLWPGLLALAASPELFRQAQGGGADLPVAFAVVLFAVAAAVWLMRGDPVALVLAFAFAASALAIKNEGLPETVLVLVVISLAANRAGRRRLVLLWAAFAGGLALALPWFAWREAHGLHGDISLTRAFDPGYLSDRTGRIGPALGALARHAFGPREWLIDVPLALALAVACAFLARRSLYLTPAVLLVLGFALLVWVYWADSNELAYRLSTSAYRTIDTVTILAGASLAPLAEALVRAGTARSWRPRRRGAASGATSSAAG